MVSAAPAGLMFQWYLGTLPETAEVVLENRLPAHWFGPTLLATLLGIFAYFAVTWLQPRC
jgi:hypothetical protein